MKVIDGGVVAAKGFKAAGIHAGLKKSKKDMALVVSECDAATAAVFTTNTVKAAPVIWDQGIAKNAVAKAVVVNSGNANACTGKKGLEDAEETAAYAASLLGTEKSKVYVCSTGVIGVPLDMEKIHKGTEALVPLLTEKGGQEAADAICTTDTFRKEVAVSVDIGGCTVTIGGMAKGSGMIHPNMATMLCFVTTDAKISSSTLSDLLGKTVEDTFNMISVDGDMSTNDTVVILANGLAGNNKINEENAAYEIFCTKLMALCTELAKEIAADGEGASKFLTINVKGAKSFTDAKTVGMAVANSPLVKTAFFGEDPNWGRVICAVGYSGADMVPEKTIVKFGGITIFNCGVGAAYDSEALAQVMRQKDIVIDIELNMGEAEATVWTCDLSYEYVKINGEYHT